MKARTSKLSVTEKEDSDMAINKWTVMFFFASDNTLSPVIVSQLKAIKEAGFHEDTEVLVYFDPSEKGVPTKIYNVNRERKRRRLAECEKHPSLSRNLIGDGENSFVHNLKEDDIALLPPTAYSGPTAKKMFQALKNPDDMSVKGALKLFLEFCRENHRAEHYILIPVGHGMIVANDAFLPDENPVSSITLKELDGILRPFAKAVKDDKNAFELLALHSCSMSSIEVAYELQGTANYMMASEGISYVNSWPHRQLLKRLFKILKEAKETTGSSDVDGRRLIEKLYFLSYFNARDFNLSGYPLDLALCNLAKGNFTKLKKAMKKLVVALKDNVTKGASNGRGQELILLAHWDAQSYWGENYTDLFDFCRCLRARCGNNVKLGKLSTACSKVMKELEPRQLGKEATKDKSAAERERLEREERFKGLVIFSRNFGSAYQYSHGLSVYFPWSRPVENVGNGNEESVRNTEEITKVLAGIKNAKARELLEGYLSRAKGILERYREYDFRRELGKDSWLSFLELYFKETQRESRKQEDNRNKAETDGDGSGSSERIPVSGVPGGGITDVVPGVALTKDSPSSGVACICTTIKNYPEVKEHSETRRGRGRNAKLVAAVKEEEIPKDLLEEYSIS